MRPNRAAFCMLRSALRGTTGSADAKPFIKAGLQNCCAVKKFMLRRLSLVPGAAAIPDDMGMFIWLENEVELVPSRLGAVADDSEGTALGSSDGPMAGYR